MYFAIFFLLFFIIDILFVSGFEVLGLIPINYLVAGVVFFFSFFLKKHFKVFEIDLKYHFLGLFFEDSVNNESKYRND